VHRPSNVDNEAMLRCILEALIDISDDVPVLFPVHPHTWQRIVQFGVTIPESDRLRLLGPLPYLEFLNLQRHATVVVTDSGGIQEETTFMKVPCLTLRENTERPVTVTLGTNLLIGRNVQRLPAEVRRILTGDTKAGQVPPLWDGCASERIAKIIAA
jgi:UDP-N-acetylglucosamine 2-epimerase (non-hydrolysing)